MKPIKALALVLALAMLMAPLLVARPVNAVAPIYFSAQPVAVLPLTNLNVSLNGLEVASTPNPTGDTFNVEIHLIGATVANQPSGVAGVEVHFNFTQWLPYAVPTGFVDELGTGSGVLVGPQTSLLYGIAANFFNSSGGKVTNPLLYNTAEEYGVAAAATNGNWNGADGLVAIITFKITGQPSGALLQPDFYAPAIFTGASAVGGDTNGITLDAVWATLYLHASPLNLSAPNVFITPVTYTGSAPLGSLFNYTVFLNADSFWDVAGFDVQVTWNNTLINLVAYAEGNWLHQFGDPTFGFWNVLPGSIEAVFTKLANSGASGGIDSIVQLEFNVTYVGNSYPPATCPIHIAFLDLASWAHPERPIAPWFGFIGAVDLTPYPGFSSADATYIAPYINPGPNVDLYTQYPDPYGGQGQNQHSDSFAPQQQVCLYAKVTYGGDRVTNKLVTFEVHDALGNKITILQNYSDINGIATVCFRIPQTDLIPGGEDPSIFGWWYVISTVELDQVTVNDTMNFQVGWLAQIVSVTANNTPYHKYTDNMNFTAVLVTIHEQPIYVLVSIDSYDSQGYPIGESTQYMYVNATRATCPFTGPSTTTTGGVYNIGPYIQGIPTWARVGTAKVIGYALTDYPRNGGTPWGPQSPATLFTIEVP